MKTTATMLTICAILTCYSALSLAEGERFIMKAGAMPDPANDEIVLFLDNKGDVDFECEMELVASAKNRGGSEGVVTSEALSKKLRAGRSYDQTFNFKSSLKRFRMRSGDDTWKLVGVTPDGFSLTCEKVGGTTPNPTDPWSSVAGGGHRDNKTGLVWSSPLGQPAPGSIHKYLSQRGYRAPTKDELLTAAQNGLGKRFHTSCPWILTDNPMVQVNIHTKQVNYNGVLNTICGPLGLAGDQAIGIK